MMTRALSPRLARVHHPSATAGRLGPLPPAHYTRLTCYRFPDPEYAAASQIVLLAVKRDAVVGKNDVLQGIDTAVEDLPALSISSFS